MRSVVVAGVSHHTAPVEVRERLALDDAGRARAAAAALAVPGVHEVVVISTCNRTELHVAGEPGSDVPVQGAALVGVLCGGGAAPAALPDPLFRVLAGEDAVVHVLSLAAGLDSLVLGETQILAQVRRAYEEAVERATVGPTFRRLYPAAFRVAKRAHTETGLSAGAASVGSIAAELAGKVFGDLERRTVLLLGAGETGATIARALAERRVARLLIAGRGLDRSSALAEQLGARALLLEEASRRLPEADIVVTAAASAGGDFVLARADVERALSARRSAHLLVIDLGLPRNVEPAVADLAGVFLYDLDDLHAVAEETRRRRQREVPKVERFVAREMAGFSDWWAAARHLDPLLRHLHGRFEEIRGRELDRTLPRLPEEYRAVLEVFSRSLVDKLLQTPTVRLKSGGARLPEMARVVRELFGLDGDGEERP